MFYIFLFSSFLFILPPTQGAIHTNETSLSEIELLGKTLFFDPILSGNNKISCASCHNPSKAWSDGLPTAIGFNGKILSRKTPTLYDVKFKNTFFWDGRAQTLEQQALGPIQAADEMNQNLNELESELINNPEYVNSFQKVFNSTEISANKIAIAIAAYERTIIHPISKFEKYRKGDSTAISESAIRGIQVFGMQKARCVSCHNTPLLGGQGFFDIGTTTSDLGRGNYSSYIYDQFAFSTPSLWNIANRAPYFHNGKAKTLEEVIEHYQNGSPIKRDSISPKFSAFKISEQDKKYLIEFLKSLSP